MKIHSLLEAQTDPKAAFIAFCVKCVCTEVSDDLEELVDEYGVDRVLERAFQECGDDFSEYEGGDDDDDRLDADDFKAEILAGAREQLGLTESLSEAAGPTCFFGAIDFSMGEAKYWFYSDLPKLVAALKETGIVDPGSWEQEPQETFADFQKFKDFIEDHFEAENGGDNAMDMGDDGPTGGKKAQVAWIYDAANYDPEEEPLEIEVYLNKPIDDLEFVERAEGK